MCRRSVASVGAAVLVGAVAAAVTIDALLGDASKPTPAAGQSRPLISAHQREKGQIAPADTMGRLLVVGARGSCRAFLLPELATATAPAGGCAAARAPAAVTLATARIRRLLGAKVLQIRSVAGLGDGRRAVLVSLDVRPRLDAVGVLDGEHLVARPELANADIESIEASPRGRYVVVRGRTSGLWVLDRAGRLVLRDRFRLSLLPALDTAWSADERWLAIATGRSVLLVSIGAGAERAVRMPVPAASVEWLPG